MECCEAEEKILEELAFECLCCVSRDFQCDLVGIDLQYILQSLFVMCFASSCTLNLNCSKLNYGD